MICMKKSSPCGGSEVSFRDLFAFPGFSSLEEEVEIDEGDEDLDLFFPPLFKIGILVIDEGEGLLQGLYGGIFQLPHYIRFGKSAYQGIIV